jgi:hypothetical protein
LNPHKEGKLSLPGVNYEPLNSKTEVYEICHQENHNGKKICEEDASSKREEGSSSNLEKGTISAAA